ncbi:MAG: hypothetical protein A3K77_05515 [Euryarchaeota archaeon RBG_13_31_8]|nr:MAG: hypothetical protein A3K77_05515 [Euryarchaeota archaeon RBG_13_31_8]
MIILGAINLVLLILGLIFFIPRENLKIKKSGFFKNLKNQLPYILIIIGVVVFHLVEVNFIDPYFSTNDYANVIRSFEGDIVYWFSQHWTPVLVYFFVIMYIAVYPFTLWFSPLYFLLINNKKAMKTLAYGTLLIYLITLPFYLFLPITNVFTYYNVKSALESIIPYVESFFYTTTTQNNCLPSLHTAMTILIAYSVSLVGNKKLTYFSVFTAITIIISVIYLSIHWITDVITGAILSIGVILLLRKVLKEQKYE